MMRQTKQLLKLLSCCLIALPTLCFPQDFLFGNPKTDKTTRINLPDKRQVLIKAHIVNIDQDYTHELGLSFNTTTSTITTPGGFTLNLPSTQTGTHTLRVPIAQMSEGALLDVTLSALEQQGHAELISDPQIVTLNKQSAIIESGQEVPYQQSTESGATSVAFKKAVLRLKVTPDIQNKQSILLHLSINQDQVSSLTVNGVPAINTQQLQTQVLMKNNTTLVLGGIFQNNKSQQDQSVPYLSKIPLLGTLFQNHQMTSDRKQLLIFVTPVILK